MIRICKWSLALLVVSVPSTMAQSNDSADALKLRSSSKCFCGGERRHSYDRIRQVLSTPLKSPGVKFEEQPLQLALEQLMEAYQLPIQLDYAALEDAGMTRDEPVTIDIKDMSLRSALRLILNQRQLTYVIENEVLMVTTPEAADDELVACVYNVSDIVGSDPKGVELRELADTIKSVVHPVAWSSSINSPGEINRLRNGLLVISQTTGMQEQVQDLLTSIRQARAETKLGAGDETMGATIDDVELKTGSDGRMDRYGPRIMPSPGD
jgi:hypothetical protein